MRFQQFIAFLLLLALMTGCYSTTLIQSIPTGAKIYVDGEPVGKTPYLIRDSKITGASTAIRLELDEHETFITYMSKDEEINVGALIGGFFFTIPFLWSMEYNTVHTYDLPKIEENNKILQH